MKKYFVLNLCQKDFIKKHGLMYLVMLMISFVTTCFGFSVGYGYSFILFFLFIIAFLLVINVIANFDYSNIANIKIVNDIYQKLGDIIQHMKLLACINIVLFVLPLFFIWFDFAENVLLNLASAAFIYSIFICIYTNINIFELRNTIINRIYHEKYVLK